ncbi:hypothetical protein Pelo_11726 [Pelomyxa schiedti]|nr:hypothetical protein Pelo_11726 [Pelomyxa schiedti]
MATSATSSFDSLFSPSPYESPAPTATTATGKPIENSLVDAVLGSPAPAPIMTSAAAPPSSTKSVYYTGEATTGSVAVDVTDEPPPSFSSSGLGSDSAASEPAAGIVGLEEDQAWVRKRQAKFIKGERRICISLTIATIAFFICLLVSFIVKRDFGFYYALNIIYLFYFGVGCAMIWAVPILKLCHKNEEAVRPWQLPFFEFYALLSILMLLLAEAAIISFAIYMPEYVDYQCRHISACDTSDIDPIVGLGIALACFTAVGLVLFCVWPLRLLCKWVSIIRKRSNLPATRMTPIVMTLEKYLPRYLDLLRLATEKGTAAFRRNAEFICKLSCCLIAVWMILLFFSCLIISSIREGLPTGLVLFCDVYDFICYILLVSLAEGLKATGNAAATVILTNATSTM